jgi:hypothetical protein
MNDGLNKECCIMGALRSTHVSMGVVSLSLALAAVGCAAQSAEEDPAEDHGSAAAALETKCCGDGAACSCGRGCSCGNSGACGENGCSGRLGIPWGGNPPGGGGGGCWGGPFGGRGDFGPPWFGGGNEPWGGGFGPSFGPSFGPGFGPGFGGQFDAGHFGGVVRPGQEGHRGQGHRS